MSLIDDAYYEGLEQGRNNLAKYVNVIAAKDTEIAELKAILTKILALPDDTSAAYIKALIHDHIKTV